MGKFFETKFLDKKALALKNNGLCFKANAFLSLQMLT